MKFKRILAVVLSVLMTVSMASFTVSAKAELAGEPSFSEIAAVNPKRILQNEKARTSTLYDVENDIVYVHVQPDFDKLTTSSPDDTLYINMYTYGSGVKFTATAETMYAVLLMRSNYETNAVQAGFYSTLGGCNSPAMSYAGDETWKKMIFPIAIPAAKVGTACEHFWIRPLGNVKVNGGVAGEKYLPEDTYYDIAGVALFDDEASAEAYDIAALSSAAITISFDANGGEGEFDSYTVGSGKYYDSFIEFPTETPVAPEGMEFNGWAASPNGTPLTGDVPTPEESTTYYAVYKYVEQDGVEYDDIYLQNVYYKLLNDKNLTIGYLGGSVTVGSGADNAGKNSKVAWRALTTQWFKDNFPNAAITEVYAGIGGTGSRFGSYRMTRDLDLANNTIDLLFVDSCVNDSYEGFGVKDKDDLKGNDAVIVAKILENNPKCQVVFINVCNDSTILKEEDSGATSVHREFADENGFAFIDFKVGMARELMGDDTVLAATSAAVSEKWDTYYSDSVHPKAEGYKVYFEYLRDELLCDLIDEELTLSKTKYEDTVPAALDLDTVDTDRYCAGAPNSNVLTSISYIKNYLNGQDNGFVGTDSMKASKEGYSTTFKFTGKNALIWGNKQSRNALLDVYIDGNVNVGSPDYTIDMWRNQDMSQSFMFPVLPEDLEEAREVTVTLVLRKNVDQATRDEAAGKPAATVGDRMSNVINNISIKGGQMDSVEFLNSPEEFKQQVVYDDVVIPPAGMQLKIDSTPMVFEEMEYDGKQVVKTYYNGTNSSNNFAIDGWNIKTYGTVAGEFYNYATIYMYVDDPEFKTDGYKPDIRIREGASGMQTFMADVAVTPNAWQRISIDISDIEDNNSTPYDDFEQYHFRHFGGAPATNFTGVTVYAEKIVFSQEDPGDWADLNARITGITINGEAMTGYNSAVNSYSIELPYGTTEVPVIAATANVDGAVVEIKQATSLTDTATVTLKGETEADDIVYTLTFSVFDDVRIEEINVAGKNIYANGNTEYKVNLTAGTTEVPAIEVVVEGDKTRVTVEAAETLEDTTVITVTYKDGTVETYTISYYVLPSLAEMYPDATIIYVSQNGAGTKDGSSIENAAADIRATLIAHKGDEGKVVFALVDQVTVKTNEPTAIPKDTVITSAGGSIRMPVQFVIAYVGGRLAFENVDIYHVTTSGDPAQERYFVAGCNDLIMRNVRAIPMTTIEGATRTSPLYVQPGADGGFFNDLTREVEITIENTTGISVRGGGFGGTTTNKGFNYTFSGNTAVGTYYGGGHATNANKPVSDRTINGDVTLTVEDEVTINNVYGTNGAVVTGNVYFYINGGKISNLYYGAANGIGAVNGHSVIVIDGGEVSKIATATVKSALPRVLLVNENTSVMPESVAGPTHTVTYTGNGSAEVTVADDGAVAVTLTSETAQWVEITDVNGTKKYDMATDSEVVLAHDFTYALAEGTTSIVFSEGESVTFKAYEADGAKADSENTVYGLAGTPVPTPDAVEVKDEHFEFVGWALESDPEKTIVTDFYTFTPNGATYVAIFKQAPCAQFIAYNGNGAAEDMDTTIYGTTGAAIVAPEAPAAREHIIFVGWKLGDEIVEDFGTFSDEKKIFYATYELEPAAEFLLADGMGVYTMIYGVAGDAIVAPEAPEAEEHFTFVGWASAGTTEVVDNLGTFERDTIKKFVPVFEEDPKFTITIMDGDVKVAEVTDYAGFEYTLEKLAHTPTTRFVGYAVTAGATEATHFAGDELEVTENATFYAVRKEIVLEDAEYTFYGEYDYSEGKYVVEMYYEGPKANMTAFGIQYNTEALANVKVAYSDELQSTGTNKVNDAENGVYYDVVYPTEGGSFGDDMKTPVLVATLTFDMTDYAALNAAEDLVKATISAPITGAYANGEWQYIKHDDEFSLDIASRVYPIYFTALEDDKDIEITVTGADADISTVTCPTEGKMLTAIEFTIETADGEEPGLVTYYADGVSMGELTAGDDGITYTIPAEKVLGNITIELSYGEPIPEVVIIGIDAPEVLKTPDTTAKIGDGNYTLDSVTWNVDGDEFGFDTAYTVTVTITADEGYAFTGKTVYTINGEEAVMKRVDRDTIEVCYTFAPTVKELGTLSVTAQLIRDKADAAYNNFGTITVYDANGTVVEEITEGTEAGNKITAQFTLLAGEYTVVIAKNGYLTETYDATIAYKSTTSVLANLVAGNVYGETNDNEINLYDFVAVTSAFDYDVTDEAKATVDIDEDGVVTVFDLAYVKANMGKKAE